MKNIPIVLAFFAFSCLAKNPDYELLLCSDGRLANCSDCSNKSAKVLNSFEIDKVKNRVLVLEYDKEKNFKKSFVLDQCSIFDSGNWYCSYGTDDEYHRYKSHGGFIEFVFKTLSEYPIVRFCGKGVNSN